MITTATTRIRKPTIATIQIQAVDSEGCSEPDGSSPGAAVSLVVGAGAGAAVCDGVGSGVAVFSGAVGAPRVDVATVKVKVFDVGWRSLETILQVTSYSPAAASATSGWVTTADRPSRMRGMDR